MRKIIKIAGKSPAIEESLRTAELLAVTDVTTLIFGETGTGKTLFSEYIHQKSPRKHKPYKVVNCASLSEEQLESSLFACDKRLDDQQRSPIEQANNGTLFLDEISELPLAMQGKLLHFLQSAECQSTKSLQSEPYNRHLS